MAAQERATPSDTWHAKGVNEHDYQNANPIDRWNMAVAHGLQLDIVTPSTLEHPTIVKGSGIVVAPRFHNGTISATLPQSGQVLVYFEGLIFGQYKELHHPERYKAAVHHAAGRAITKYPTSALCTIDATELHTVGTYTCAGSNHNDNVTLSDPETVQQWCNQ